MDSILESTSPHLLISSETIIRIERDYTLQDDMIRFITIPSHSIMYPLPMDPIFKLVPRINDMFAKAESVNKWTILENLIAWLTGYLSYWFVETYYDKVRNISSHFSSQLTPSS
jgi:hypothetical protein